MSTEHSPTPAQVHVGKDRLAAGIRLPYGSPRPWYCRSCGQESEPRRHAPSGWYSLARHTGNAESPVMRLGVYCSIACLEDQLPRLAGIDGEVGVSRALASPFTQAKDARRLCTRCGRSYVPDPGEPDDHACCHGCRPRVLS